MKVSLIKVDLKNDEKIELRSPKIEGARIFVDYLQKMAAESSHQLNLTPEAAKQITVEAQREKIKTFEEHPNNFYIVAVQTGEIVASLCFRAFNMPVGEHCGEFGMAVLEKLQGQGVGSAMLKCCLQESKKVGIWNLRCSVRTSNGKAIRQYEKFGFERAGTLKQVAKIQGFYVDEHLYQHLDTPHN